MYSYFSIVMLIMLPLLVLELLVLVELEIVNSCEKNNGGCSHHCEHAVVGPHAPVTMDTGSIQMRKHA